MFWIVLGCVTLALLLLKLGALLVWVAVLTAALKGLLAVATMGALALISWHVWRQRSSR